MGLDLRRIQALDVEAVAAFVIEGMRPELYPLNLGREKVIGVIHAFIEPNRDQFQLAAFEDGQMVGGIAAVAMPMLFFEHHEAHVILCRATKPGAGRRLLRELRAWADSDMRIRRVVWPMEFHADPRIQMVAARAGFKNQLTVCSYYKGVL